MLNSKVKFISGGPLIYHYRMSYTSSNIFFKTLFETRFGNHFRSITKHWKPPHSNVKKASLPRVVLVMTSHSSLRKI